jgi:hypothetical protein
VAKQDMNSWIRQTAGLSDGDQAAQGQGAGALKLTEEQTARVEKLVEVTGCELREALELVKDHAESAGGDPTPAGHAGAGTGTSEAPPRESLASRMNRAIRSI